MEFSLSLRTKVCRSEIKWIEIKHSGKYTKAQDFFEHPDSHKLRWIEKAFVDCLKWKK